VRGSDRQCPLEQANPRGAPLTPLTLPCAAPTDKCLPRGHRLLRLTLRARLRQTQCPLEQALALFIPDLRNSVARNRKETTAPGAVEPEQDFLASRLSSAFTVKVSSGNAPVPSESCSIGGGVRPFQQQPRPVRKPAPRKPPRSGEVAGRLRVLCGAWPGRSWSRLASTRRPGGRARRKVASQSCRGKSRNKSTRVVGGGRVHRSAAGAGATVRQQAMPRRAAAATRRAPDTFQAAGVRQPEPAAVVLDSQPRP